jgi:hypothetical protein
MHQIIPGSLIRKLIQYFVSLLFYPFGACMSAPLYPVPAMILAQLAVDTGHQGMALRFA